MKRSALIINQGIPRSTLILITAMAALTVANLHYNVPVLEEISRDLGVAQVKANLITVFTQAGYAAGLLFIVALGDLFDARRIIAVNFGVLVASLVCFAVGQRIEFLLCASIVTGLSSVAVQMYIPLISKFSKPAEKARNVGFVISGIVVGVLLGRTVGGFVGEWLGWRMLYWGAAALMAVSCLLVLWLMPPLEASFSGSYRQLMESIFGILKKHPKILGNATCAGLCFASFNTLWACMAFHLADEPFRAGSDAVGYLGLCGLLTALAVAGIGKYVDRLGVRRFNLMGFLLTGLAWLALFKFGNSYMGLILGIILLDVGQQCVGVANQSTTLALEPQAASRINTVYMTIFFIFGSLGTFLSGQGWHLLKWNGVVIAGAALVLASAATTIRRRK